MRTTATTIDDAIGKQPSYKLGGYFEIYPTRRFFGSFTRNNVFSGAEGTGVDDTPIPQELVHNVTAGLVTFYTDGSLKYALDGDTLPVTTPYSSSEKPGVFGDKIFIVESADVKRYDISWSAVASKGANPLSLEATLTPTSTPVAVHALSETECVAFCDNEGGFTVVYFNDATGIESTSRFMFPKIVDWSGSARSMESMGTFSAAGKLNGKIYAYISNAATGVVQGIFYDPTLETWSDIFTALATDLEVSLCEFRITNAFVRNAKIYLVGQFIRTDIYQTGLPYTLVLSSDDGKIFNIDRFTQVSDMGYRLHATVGVNNKLYLGNCNRICEADSTWYFDGNDHSTSLKEVITADDFSSIVDKDTGSLEISVRAGNEQYIDDPYFSEDSMVKYYTGYTTVEGNEYVLYGTYLVESISDTFQNGKRSLILSCKNLSQYKLTDLSMPFYAEILGLSSLYDPMTEQSGKMYAASGGTRTETHFFVDLWNHIPYSNTTYNITDGSFIDNGGVGSEGYDGAHKVGIILKNDLDTILKSDANPKITGTSLTVKIYGWSKAGSVGGPNHTINLVLITCDENGDDEQTTITEDTQHWPITYPYQAAGTNPIVLTVTDMTIGRFIKRVGLVFECAASAEASPGRIEFVDNVEVPVSLSMGNTPWSRDADGTFSVPSAGQPFIMFAQKPYNAFNFIISAMFDNTVTGGVSGYPVAVGLIGLAEDASNFILARYDKVANVVEIIKVRNGLETVVVSESMGPKFSVGTLTGIQFSHRDGHFRVSMFRSTSVDWRIVLEYDWQAADGFMCTSSIVTKKCGIYGTMMAPLVRTMGYAGGAQDEIASSDGIAIGPLENHSSFPSSGDLVIDGNVYSYTAKVTHPSLILGPHQLRNFGTYPPPYGTGEAGLEMRLFDWYGNSNIYAGKLIALDNGSSFISTGSLWRVFIKTDGQIVWLYNRSRHYSANTQIMRTPGTVTMRIWPGLGGFTGISLKTGSFKRHAYGAYAMLNLSGSIKCYWFAGSGGETDTTIGDLINIVTRLCGAKAVFPGDKYIPSLNVIDEVDLYQDSYADGADVEFELDGPASFVMRTNIKVKSENYEDGDDFVNDTGLNVVIENLGSGNHSIAVVSTPSNTQLHKFLYSSGTSAQKYRFLFHEDTLSFYQNNRWVWSIVFDELIYTQTTYLSLKLYALVLLEFTNIYIRDLHDWREAIYIDLETDGFSALSSIIQERPVEIEPTSDGSLRFYYDRERDVVIHPLAPIYHKHRRSLPQDAASDAIIYGAKEVVTIQNHDFSEALGFSTRLIRVPNLTVGGIEAGQRMLERTYQNRNRHEIGIRPDIRIEIGDILNIFYTASGTGRVVSFSVIVETVDLAWSQSQSEVSTQMNITGRDYVAP